jgi:ATP-dependent Clp protease ATP-binding subunit ClpX
MVAVARLLTPAELVHHLDTFVIGQSHAKRRLAMAVYRHYLGRRLRQLPGACANDLGPQHQLLLGPTGVGKSLLVKSIAHMLGVPTAFTAATSLVETGYVGTPVEGMFAVLLERAGGDAALAENGIVFLDEFDKLRRAADVGRDVSGEGVQNGLLTLMDGRAVRLRHRDREVSLDSSNVLFLCTGAFAGLGQVVRRRRARDGSALGFTGARGASAAQRSGTGRGSDARAAAKASPEDLIEYGIIPELVGRFTGIVELHALSRSDLERVLVESKTSPLRAQQRLFELHGVRLEVTSDARGALVDRAMAHGLGARALHRVVSEAFAELEFRLPRLAEMGVGAVRMTRAAVEGHSAPVFVHRRELRDWVAPSPSAEQLRLGAPGQPSRSEPPRPRPTRVQPDPRPRVPRRPSPTPGQPTLFESGG